MLDSHNKEYHINATKDDIGAYCIIPGDPGRCELIASYLENVKHIGMNREYNIYTGELSGERVTVCSTGIGGPSAAIAIEELAHCGAHTFIRLGTCGGISMKVKAGDVVIASGAVRFEGTSREYAPIEFPAVADFSVLSALAEASNRLGKSENTHIGVVQCKDSFYGQHSPLSMPVSYELTDKWEAWKRLGVLASEMESAALYTVSAARSLRSGALFLAVWNQERANAGLDTDASESHDMREIIPVCIEALKIIIEKDKKH